MLLLVKKLTNTLIEQTRSRPQEILEFRMNKKMGTFSFNPPINLVEEGKWLMGVTSFEATIFVVNKISENNSFSIIQMVYQVVGKYLSIQKIELLIN